MKRRAFAAAAVAATVAPVAMAQALPTTPVRLVVGFPPGGGTDVLARLLAHKLGPMWGTTVIVDNRAGASGTIAADQVARVAADGATLLMAHVSSHGIAPGLPKKLGYSAERDFTAISLVGATPQMLICGADQPVKTVPGLIDLCRKNPGKIIFGSAGSGSAQHLALELFRLQAKVDVLHVPYKGSAPLVNDMLGGQIQYSFEGMTTATPLVRDGRMAALAQTRPRRSKTHPTVPTLAELGFAGFDASIWFGLVAPRGLPPALVARMNADVNTVLAMPDVVDKLEQYGAEDGGGSPQRFDEFMRQERAKWAQVIKSANVTGES